MQGRGESVEVKIWTERVTGGEWFVRSSRWTRGGREEEDEVKEGSLLLLSFEPKQQKRRKQICSSKYIWCAY